MMELSPAELVKKPPQGEGENRAQTSSIYGSVRDMDKKITVWSALGVAYSATCAPIAILIFLSLTIGTGGSPVFIYSYIISTIMNMFVCISLAEMSSARPHSSGQVVWSAEFAQGKHQTLYSYYAGFFAVYCWLFWYIST